MWPAACSPCCSTSAPARSRARTAGSRPPCGPARKPGPTASSLPGACSPPSPYAIQAASATSADNAAAAASLSGTLPATQLSGTLEDARLSANIPRLDSSPTFTGTVKAGTFSGDGSGLVNLNSLQLTGPLTLGMDPVRVGGYDTAGNARGVAVAGNYAYMADRDAGLQVIDISHPANPQRVGGYDTAGTAVGVAVAGPYAYVADYTAGLQVIDISNPANPQRVGGYDTAGYADTVAVAGNYAYVADDTAGLQVVDISNPANPQRVGGYDTAGNAFGVAVAGNYAYVADDTAGLQVIDISNPANPQRVGGYDTAGKSLGVTVAGNYAYVADYTAGLQVIDISDPTNPQRVGGYDTAGNASGVAVAGNYAYVADHTAGLQVIDISNPANPQRVGGCDTAGNADGVAVAGNYAYVADNAAGLQILAVGTVASMNGIVRASVFAGDGAGLTGVNADQLDGQHGAFYQNAANLNAGTLADARLSANAALLNANQTFSGINTLANPANSFAGDGSGLVNLNLNRSDGSSLTVGQAWGEGPFQVYGSTWVLDQHNDSFGYYFTRSSAWQSFTCATSGTLAAVKAWVYSYSGGPWSATLNLYAGEGTAGALLASQPVAGDGVMQERTFALETPVALTAGNQYTFAFQNASATLRVRGSGNVYAGGRCDYSADYDYHFSTWMTDTAAAPALVVQPNTLYVGIGKANPTSALDVNGTVTATAFAGNGAGMANVNADQLDGQQGAYYLNAANLNAGTLGDARLSANIPRLDSSPTFTGTVKAGTFSGDGSGLVNLNSLQLTGPLTLGMDPVRVGGYVTGWAQGVAVAGNYAYVADNSGGLQVIDISNPANPQRVGGYDTTGFAYGVAVASNYAYVADYGAGLQVIDISNPALPQRVGGYDTAGLGYGVAVAGNYAYVADYGAGLQVIDISNPANPQRVGGYDTAGVAMGVAVAGNYAYVADGGAGLQVISISNPANPQRVGGYDTAGSVHGVAVAGNYAYVADSGAGLQVIDISNPADPQRVGGYDTGENARGVAVAGNYAYVADYAAGLQVIDISNPADPQRVGGYDTAGNALGVAVAGNYACVADANAGLQVVAIDPVATMSGIVRANAFAGDGAGLTNLDATDLTGTVADARLSANVARLNASQTFTAANTFNNAGNSFTGSGAGVTGVNADQLDGQHGSFYQNAGNLTAGTVSDGRLSANVAKLDAGQTFTGNNTFTKAVGIGTSTPAYALEVNAAGNAQIGIKSTDSSGRLWTLQSTGASSLMSMPPGPGSFQIWDRTAGSSRLMITAAGNVGLGTTPSHALDLAGGAYCDGAQWQNASDRDAKERFTAIKPAEVLAKVAKLPITEWKYKSERAEVKHLGPVAQDFHAAFGLGDNDKAIGTGDEAGVALAAIQGLNQKVEAQAAQLRAKDAELQSLKASVAELQEAIRRLTPTSK